MPVTSIARLGEVEYILAPLSTTTKGKSVIGRLDLPILINEQLEPGTKLDYVVAHEAGHRLTLDMIILAIDNAPETFKRTPNLSSALIDYMINDLDLKESGLHFRHPKTKQNLTRTFREARRNRLPSDEDAREFIAEVFANWATGEGQVSPKIDFFFSRLLEKKTANILPSIELGASQREFSSTTNDNLPQWFDPSRKTTNAETHPPSAEAQFNLPSRHQISQTTRRVIESINQVPNVLSPKPVMPDWYDPSTKKPTTPTTSKFSNLTTYRVKAYKTEDKSLQDMQLIQAASGREAISQLRTAYPSPIYYIEAEIEKY